MSDVVIAIIVAVVLVVLSGFIFVGCDRYSDRKQEIKLACIQNGGIWTQDKCIYSKGDA